ncbi:MAG: DUF4250 domain-containing protein [Bacteroidales bacterium]|nr:DUF4250 domain-containing protein [Bacteroidales bacterium]
MDKLPKDPAILVSFLNTKLRDEYFSLEALCEDMDINLEELLTHLKSLGYEYNASMNKVW